VNIVVMLFSDRVVHCEIIKWIVAVILSECVAVDILLPFAEQEPGELYQQVTDNNEEEEEEKKKKR
jgi:hypothetical protein